MISFLLFDKHIFQRESTKKGVVLIQATLEDVHSLYKLQDDIFELRYTSSCQSVMFKCDELSIYLIPLITQQDVAVEYIRVYDGKPA